MINDIDSLKETISKNFKEVMSQYGAIRGSNLLKDILHTQLYEMYEILQVTSTEANISERIHKETKYDCFWRGQYGTCGIITIYIPKSEATDQLIIDLKDRYDK